MNKRHERVLSAALDPARLRGALRWETGLALVVVIIGIVGASVSSQFFTSNNIFNLGLSYGEIAIMTLPMTLIVISGEIDLSVASILGMSSALLGYLWARHWPMLGIFLLVAVVGLAAGAVNGLLVTRLGLPSLAVTIGTLAMYRGIATILLGPNTVANFPVTYTNLGVNAFPFTGNDLTYSAAIFIVLAIVFGIVLHATPFGRSVYAMGASVEAAQFAGIQNALFLTNFNQEAAGIVTGALLLLSVFGRNAASFAGRLREWLPAGRRGRGPESPAGRPPASVTPP